MSPSKNRNSILRTFFVPMAIALALLTCTAERAAATPMTPAPWYDATVSAFSQSGGGGYTIGEDFTVGATGIEITALGFVDRDGHALAAAHQVSLYTLTGNSSDNNGTLDATVTVPAGSVGTLIDGIRYVNLAHAIDLAPGTLASVVAYGFSDSDPYNCCGHSGLPSTGNLIWVGADRYAVGAAGLPPFVSSDGNAHAAAGFLFVNTPEPSSLVLCGLGAVGLLLAARRRRKD